MNVRNYLNAAVEIGSSAFQRRRWTSRRIGYIGWLGHKNLGDEAMFEAARLLYPQDCVSEYGGRTRERALRYVGLSGRAAFKEVHLGGGTLLSPGYQGAVETALNQGLEVSTLGTGAGASGFTQTVESLDPSWTKLLLRCRRVGVRGPRTARKLQSAGVQCLVIGDLALALTPPKALDVSVHGDVLFNYAASADVSMNASLEIRDAICEALRALLADGARVIPVAFHTDDDAPMREILEQAGIGSLAIEHPSTFAEYVALAETARIGVGVRLHAMILSACLGIPVVNVAYREKAHDFAESVDMPELVVDPNRGQLADFTKTVLRCRDLAPERGAVLHKACLEWKIRQGRYVNE